MAAQIGKDLLARNDELEMAIEVSRSHVRIWKRG